MAERGPVILLAAVGSLAAARVTGFTAANVLIASVLAGLLLLSTDRRVPPIGKSLATGIAVGVAAALAWGLTEVALANIAVPPDWDFRWFWIQGRVAAEGANFYEPWHAAAIARELGLGSGFIEELGFWYPPVTMLLFAPLGFFELSVAVAIIYVVMGVAFLAVAVLLWRLFLRGAGASGLPVVLALLLLLRPTLSTVVYGQTNFLVLLAILLVWMTWGRAWSGAAFVAGLAVKLVVAPLALILLVRSSPRAVVTAASTAVVLVVVSVVAFGPQTVLSYVIDNPTARAPDWLYSQEVNQSLLAFSIRTVGQEFSPGPALLNYLYLNFALLVGGVTAVLAFDRRVEIGFVLSAAITAGLLVFPGTLEHYAVLLVAPLLHLWTVRDSIRWGSFAVAGLTVVSVALMGIADGRAATSALALVWLAVVGLAAWSAHHRHADSGVAEPVLADVGAHPAPARSWRGGIPAALAMRLPMPGALATVTSRIGGAARRIRLPSTAITMVAVLMALYLTCAVLVTLVHHSIVGDAWSRIANAYYVLYSRDPHLAAMGFVWNPLPSLMALPLLPFGAVWPALIREGFIANVYSVVFMAAATYHLWQMLIETGVGRRVAVVVALIFAAHPMIIEYGANGMTEALFIFLLVVLVRYLARWIEGGTTSHLVIAALAAAAGYLVRYEAAPMAAAAGAVVGIVTLWKTTGPLRDRVIAAGADVALFAVPITAMFVAWAIASWAIIGQPFEQFSSTYGTTSQLAADAENIYYGTGQGTLGAISHTTRQVLGLQPFFLVIVVAGCYAALVRRDARVLAALAVFGSIMAFTVWAFLTGKTGGWLRYYITLIPFATIMVGWALAALNTERLRGGVRLPRLQRAGMTTIAAVLIAFNGSGIVTAVGTMIDGALGRPQRYITDTHRWETSREVASYLDAMELEDGSVLLDVFLGFPIVMQAEEPRQFVITPDRDFDAVLADPVTFGVEYLLVPPPDYGLNELDAVNRAYPDLYFEGGGMAELAHHFSSRAQGGEWRLYRLEPDAISRP